MPLADEQFEYRGLVFGRECPIMVNRAEGFEGFEVRSSDADQPRGDGSLRGFDYAAARNISFELVAWEADLDGSVYEAAWQTIRSAFRPSRSEDYPLSFKRPGMPERMVYCRPIQLVRVEEWNRHNRYGYPPVILKAVDPRIYSVDEKTGMVPVYATTAGGFDFPLANFPLDFTGGLQNEYVAINEGTADAHPLIRIYGPKSGTFEGFTLTNSTTGQTVTVSTVMSLNQILTIDMPAMATGANRLIVSLDGATRYASWAQPREPFFLAPGANNLRFEVNGTTTNALCTVQWRDTWMD